MIVSFKAEQHVYRDASGDVLPSITQMLKAAGLVDDRWFSEESSVRGTAVHQLTADWDLGAITDLESVVSPYKGWLCAHVRGLELVRPEFEHIEQVFGHPTFRFAGRPDRIGTVNGRPALVEIKSGAYDPVCGVQLALQAILVSPVLEIAPESFSRYGWYPQANGRFRLRRFEDRADFLTARKVIAQCCGK